MARKESVTKNMILETAVQLAKEEGIENVTARKLANKNHYPAIDVLQSISRCMSMITDKAHKAAAGKLKNIMATYNEAEDLINIGAYKKGSNPNIDNAISKIDAVNDFLLQTTDEKYDFEQTVELLEGLFDK